MDPISALGLAASIIAVVQLTQSALTNVGSSDHNKTDLNRLLGLANGFKGAYESLEYRLNGEDDESRATLLRHLKEPAKECKMVLKCLQERLEKISFIGQYIVGLHFDKKFKKCIERFREQKELFELMMQVDQQVMLLEIKKFLHKTEEIILMLQSSTEENGKHWEEFAECTREHRERSRAYYETTERTLAEVHATISAQKAQAEEATKAANQKSIVSWLSNTDPRSNHDAAKSKREGTTGNWFIKGETYMQWLTKPGSFLWIHGIPGCGKSVLCSTIIDETESYCSMNTTKEIQLAYYYFSFTDSEKQKPINFLRSIIAQLMRGGSQIPTEVQNLYNSYSAGAAPSDALKLALKSLLKTPVESYILIDALDECPSNQGAREELCKLLVEISSWSLGLHMLATSRREMDIEENLAAIMPLVAVPIQNSVVNADIWLYVRSQIATEVKLSRWAEKIPEIEKTLVEKADGMFRWVFCQIDALKKCRSHNEILRALKTLPKTLDETYQRILEDINERDHARATSALRWLMFSRRPLTVEELAEASILDPDSDELFDIDDRFENPRDILQVLSSLLTTSSEYSKILGINRLEYEKVEVVRIAHFSVQEYLLSDRMQPSLGLIFRIEELASQHIIAKGCIHYLHYCATTEVRSPTSNKFVSSYFQSFPILIYSSEYWAKHVSACGNIESTFVELICQFLNTQSWLNYWVGLGKIHSPTMMEFEQMAPPLYWATCLQIASVVKELISSGADVNVQGGRHGTALQAACFRQNEALVSLLLEKGADVNAQGRSFYGSALQAACTGQNETIVSLLLEKGADVNARRGYHGNSVLMVACAHRNKAIVSVLLERGADVNAQGGGCGNLYGQWGDYGTALQAACKGQDETIVSLLLEKGADINAQGGFLGNALQAACDGRKKEIVSFLLKRGADINAQGGYFGNALQAACSWKNEAIVAMLLSEGADVNARGGIHGNALRAALNSRSGDADSRTVLSLLECGAEPDTKGDEEMIQALSVKDYELLAWLLMERKKKREAEGRDWSTTDDSEGDADDSEKDEGSITEDSGEGQGSDLEEMPEVNQDLDEMGAVGLVAN